MVSDLLISLRQIPSVRRGNSGLRSLLCSSFDAFIYRLKGSLDVRLLLDKMQVSRVNVYVLELAKADVRYDFVQLRSRGIQHFIVDLGARYLSNFFNQVRRSE